MLLDASMGTRLVAVGLDLRGDDPCLWNLTRAWQVLDLHRRDVAAGSEAVFTNTFGANRTWLERYGRGDAVSEINRRAAELARAAAGPVRFVVGSIGPTATDNPRALREQAEALLDAGADALALETCRVEQALAALGSGALDLGVPVLVGLYAWPEPQAATAARLVEAGATFVGANCFADAGLARRLIEACSAAAIPFWLKPATVGPGGASLAPADFARLAARLHQVGSGLLGGCCGTTDEHLRAIRAEWG